MRCAHATRVTRSFRACAIGRRPRYAIAASVHRHTPKVSNKIPQHLGVLSPLRIKFATGRTSGNFFTILFTIL
ncbi:hypothetical protein BJP36_38465 [Moorena producens JHB]|uniref:Uncharacterized protein n=1 Tax=Moorena producens (strain JHB) TaxID=1454205 RepID=A0A9Q9UWJ9_MOOP1|nr:hypothetical protein [Moorena producens]WAN69964.1 hypothetical protein BJP36_38465 [Moorena producens JHB]